MLIQSNFRYPLCEPFAGAMRAEDSYTTFGGNTSFTNNSATTGGSLWQQGPRSVESRQCVHCNGAFALRVVTPYLGLGRAFTFLVVCLSE